MDGEKLKADQTVLLEKGERHTVALRQFQDESRAHVAAQTQVDSNDEVAVAAFNAKAKELNEQMVQINQNADLLNKEKDSFNARSAAWNKRCAGMVVRQADRDAVLKAR